MALAPPSAVSDTRAASRSASDRWVLWTAGILAVVVFAVAWWRHATFRSGTIDLAVFDQAIWKLAHLSSPEVTTIGWNAFADHLSPVLVVFAPLYRIAATPLWLLGAQALAVGAGYLALGPLLSALEVPRRFMGPLRVAYVASPLLWNAALFDFHPTTLAIPFLLVGLRAAVLDQRRLLVVAVVALLFLRDDLGLAAACCALVGITDVAPRRRWFRIGLVAAGLGWMLFGGAVAAVLGSDRHWAFHYQYLAASPSEAVLHPARSLVRLVAGLWRADNFSLGMFGYLLPLGFLPLLRPARLGLALVVALPLLASSGVQFHSPHFHYGAFVFPFLLVAAASGLRRLPEPVEGRAAMLLAALALAGLLGVGPALNGNLNKVTVNRADALRALEFIAPDDRVVATDAFGPHLSQRQTLLMFPFPLAEAHPDFPLPEHTTRVTPEAVSRVDAIVVGPPRFPDELPAYEAFASSSFLSQFPVVRHIGEVTVYQRR